jgi:hypothetical protein
MKAFLEGGFGEKGVGSAGSLVAKTSKWMGRASAKHFANAALSFSLSADLLSFTETRASMVSYAKCSFSCQQSSAVEASFGSLIPNLSGEGREATVEIGMVMENSVDCRSTVVQGMIAVQDEELW